MTQIDICVKQLCQVVHVWMLKSEQPVHHYRLPGLSLTYSSEEVLLMVQSAYMSIALLQYKQPVQHDHMEGLVPDLSYRWVVLHDCLGSPI